MTRPPDARQADPAGDLTRPMIGAFVLGPVHLAMAVVFVTANAALDTDGLLVTMPLPAGMAMAALVYWAVGARTSALRNALRRGERPDPEEIRRRFRLPRALRNVAPVLPLLLGVLSAFRSGEEGIAGLGFALAGSLTVIQPAVGMKGITRLASRPPARALWQAPPVPTPTQEPGPAPVTAPPVQRPGRMRLTLGPGPAVWLSLLVLLVLLLPIWLVGLVALVFLFGGSGAAFLIALPLSLVLFTPGVILGARIYRRAWWLDGTVLVQRRVRGNLRCDLSTAWVAGETAPALLPRGAHQMLPRLVAWHRGEEPVRLWLRDPDRGCRLLPAHELAALAQAIIYGREDDPRFLAVAGGLQELAARPFAG